jgi:hypothetical protein
MNSRNENLFQAILDDRSVEVLSLFIGEKLYQVHFPFVEVEDKITTAPSLSFRVNDIWVNISNSLLETDKDNDYYELAIEASDAPKDIAYEVSDPKQLKHPVSSFLFNRGTDNQEVEKIEIYSKNEVWDEEEMSYDFAIIWQAKNGFSLCINVLESPTEQIEITTDEELIQRTIDGCKLRKVIQ